MLKVSKNFYLHEFVPVEIYRIYGDLSIRFINPTLPRMAQWLRDRYNRSVTINNWYGGGPYNESGFRMPDTKTGARLSAHKRGVAIDFKVADMPAIEVQADLEHNGSTIYADSGITVMERGTVDWTHIACEWTPNPNVLTIFNVGG